MGLEIRRLGAGFDVLDSTGELGFYIKWSIPLLCGLYC
jgi:hypothetical protein